MTAELLLTCKLTFTVIISCTKTVKRNHDFVLVMSSIKTMTREKAIIQCRFSWLDFTQPGPSLLNVPLTYLPLKIYM